MIQHNNNKPALAAEYKAPTVKAVYALTGGAIMTPVSVSGNTHEDYDSEDMFD